jgi:hypothetical protein
MLSLAERLSVAEALSDGGEHEAALAQLAGLRAGLSPADAAHLHLVQGSIIARSGRMNDALTELRLAEALANAGSRVDVALEVEVTRASVHAALGEYSVAIPLMTRAVKALASHPELSELHRDATAELESYQQLFGTRA